MCHSHEKKSVTLIFPLIFPSVLMFMWCLCVCGTYACVVQCVAEVPIRSRRGCPAGSD